MYKPKIGDWVRLNNFERHEDLRGKIGLVVKEKDDTATFLIDFKKSINTISEFARTQLLHDGSGELPGPTGRWYGYEKLELVKRPRKRTPPIKRKGYALWIHNIECKSKRGRDHAN